MSDFTTSAGIAATAIALANIIVWAFGLSWTPQQKAGVGAISALAVFGLGLVFFPAAWPDGPTAFTTLFQALITVLAAAGAPVFADAIRSTPSTPSISSTPHRRWTSWNN
jgi:hypothetical protein